MNLITRFEIYLKNKEECCKLQKICSQERWFFHSELKNIFKEDWEKEFGKISVDFSTFCDEIAIFSIEKLRISESWQWINNNSFSIPFEIQKLRDFINLFNSKYPWKIRIALEHIKTKKDFKNGWQSIKSEDDILIFFKEFDPKVLESGKIWYVGWDIPDDYFVFKFQDQKIRILYSDNAHGFGMNYFIEPNDVVRLDKFYSKLKREEVSYIISNSEVLSSWKLS